MEVGMWSGLRVPLHSSISFLFILLPPYILPNTGPHFMHSLHRWAAPPVPFYFLSLLTGAYVFFVLNILYDKNVIFI
jgi:hypothetical protein